MLETLSEIRARVRTVLGADSVLVSDDVLDDYINQVYRTQLPADLLPPELENHFSLDTSDGTGEYGLEASILSIRGPTWIDHDRIQLFADDEYFFGFAKDRYTEEYQQPTCGLLFANQIWLYPVPDGVYTLKTTALARPDQLVNDSDKVFMPAWALPVVYGAAAFYVYDQGDYTAANSHMRMYSERIRQAGSLQLIRYTHHRAAPQW